MSRRPALVFFFVVTLLYLALSPFSVQRMGYTPEQAEAARGLLATIQYAARGDLTTLALAWPRHGLLEPVLLMPFVAAGQMLFGARSAGEDVVVSLQSVLFSAGLCTLIFVWTSQVAGSTRRAAVLSLAGAFATIIWPYAYIGLETTQSLALMLAAYIALRPTVSDSWRATAVFALAAAVAVSVKANGFMLVPSVAYLVAVRWQRHRGMAATAIALGIVVAVFVVNQYCRDLSPSRAVGSTVLFNLYRVDGASSALLNLLYIFISPNKGLLIYCPILVLAMLSMRAAFAADSRLVIFAVLAVTGLAGGSSLFVFWADDTWGARYMHAAVAPLIVCLAVARPGPLDLRAELPLVASIAGGFGVALLGVLFYYGTASLAANAAAERTIEDIQHDPDWNPPRLHAVLLKVWLGGRESGPAPWPLPRHRWFPAPGEPFAFHASPVIDLRQFAEPQPYVLRILR